MDPITPEEARRNIVALRLPQIVLDIFDKKPLPDDLDLYFRHPHVAFRFGKEHQATYGQGRITPIWADGGNYGIVAYNHGPPRQGYFRFDIESRIEQADLVGLTWQQILIREFQTLWEGEEPEDKIREIASRFDFKYVERLITELSQVRNDTFEKDATWYQSFLKEVRD
jgi:hypothetical protein